MKSSRTLKEQLQDRFRGAILGAAVGSALGFPHSGSSRVFMRALGHEAVDGYVRHRSGYFPEGQHGAAIQLLSLASRSITREGTIRESAIVEEWIPLWRENRMIERLPDIDGAMSRWLRQGSTARGCACPPGEDGASSLLCSILVGLWCHDSPEELNESVDRLTSITHEDPRVRAVNAAMATIIAHCLTHHEIVLGVVLDEAATAASRIDGEVAAAIQRIPGMLTLNEKDAFLQLSSVGDEGGGSPDRIGVEDRCLPVFMLALYSWFRDPSSPRSVLLSCLQSGGAVQLTAAIGGALAGACCGESGLPADLVTGLLDGDELRLDADQLYDRQQLERRRREL
jgi:ADP-ribosylglycohydrolase